MLLRVVVSGRAPGPLERMCSRLDCPSFVFLLVTCERGLVCARQTPDDFLRIALTVRVPNLAAGAFQRSEYFAGSALSLTQPEQYPLGRTTSSIHFCFQTPLIVLLESRELRKQIRSEVVEVQQSRSLLTSMPCGCLGRIHLSTSFLRKCTISTPYE